MILTQPSQRTSFTTDLLRNLADRIKQSDISRLCEVLSPLGDQLLEDDRLDEQQIDQRAVLKDIERYIT